MILSATEGTYIFLNFLSTSPALQVSNAVMEPGAIETNFLGLYRELNRGPRCTRVTDLNHCATLLLKAQVY